MGLTGLDADESLDYGQDYRNLKRSLVPDYFSCLQISNLCRYFIAETRVVSQIHRNLLANKFENKWYTVSCPRDEQHGQVVHEVE